MQLNLQPGLEPLPRWFLTYKSFKMRKKSSSVRCMDGKDVMVKGILPRTGEVPGLAQIST